MKMFVENRVSSLVLFVAICATFLLSSFELKAQPPVCPPGYLSATITLVQVTPTCSIRYTLCYKVNAFGTPTTIDVKISKVELLSTGFPGCDGANVDGFSQQNIQAMLTQLTNTLKRTIDFPPCPSQAVIYRVSLGTCRTDYHYVNSCGMSTSVYQICNYSVRCWHRYSVCIGPISQQPELTYLGVETVMEGEQCNTSATTTIETFPDCFSITPTYVQAPCYVVPCQP